jgi:biotin carboxyl carrier protein
VLTSLLAFPSAALPASGSMGIISARYLEAPLMGVKVGRKKLAIQNLKVEVRSQNLTPFGKNPDSILQLVTSNVYIWSMLQATVNGKIFEINPEDDNIIINGETLNWDVAQLREGYFHIIHHQRSYKAELVRTDAATKTFIWKINGRLYTVSVKDKFDLLLEKMGMSHAAGSKINSIKAPMPGLIIDLKVKTGDAVQQGNPLLILEAMKMENIIKSPGDGVVKSVKVKKGDSVEKNQILIEF